MVKVTVPRGSEHSAGLCGHTCDMKARVGYLLVLFLALPRSDEVKFGLRILHTGRQASWAGESLGNPNSSPRHFVCGDK